MSSKPIREALVLAGRRRDGDELAESAGVTHKALLPLAGMPMAARVLRALAAQAGLERIVLSCDDPALVEALTASVRAGIGNVRLEHHRSAISPAASVASYLRALSDGERVIVTTGDHALLTADIVRTFVEEALRRDIDADLVVATVTEPTYRRRFPTGRRTFVRLADVAFSGANLFLAKAPAAARIADFWIDLEHVRKQPWRLVSHFGLGTLVRFLAGRLTLARALSEVSRVVGARVHVVFLPFAEAALDVDRASDVAAATAILEASETAVENPTGAR